MESACTAGRMAGSTRRDEVWRTVHARKYFFGHGISRCWAERRLLDVECMDSRKRCEEKIAGDGVDSRRRIRGGGNVGTAARWSDAGGTGRGRGFDELPDGNFRVFRIAGTDQGFGKECRGKLRITGPGSGARMGEEEYRGVWRRPGECDDFWRERGIAFGERVDGFASGEGIVPTRDWRERRGLFAALGAGSYSGGPREK